MMCNMMYTRCIYNIYMLQITQICLENFEETSTLCQMVSKFHRVPQVFGVLCVYGCATPQRSTFLDEIHGRLQKWRLESVGCVWTPNPACKEQAQNRLNIRNAYKCHMNGSMNGSTSFAFSFFLNRSKNRAFVLARRLQVTLFPTSRHDLSPPPGHVTPGCLTALHGIRLSCTSMIMCTCFLLQSPSVNSICAYVYRYMYIILCHIVKGSNLSILFVYN